MPTGHLNSLDHSPRPRGGLGCKILLEIATKEVFHRNAFRITGLSVRATPREISKHGDKLILMQELGGDRIENTAALSRVPAPTLDELRHALQRLKNPENRILDEMFWFWPETGGKPSADSALLALSRGDVEDARKIWAANDRQAASDLGAVHNLAILHHVLALDSKATDADADGSHARQSKATDHFRKALKYWQRLVDNDQFWDAVSARIRELNEPNLPTGYARQIRATLPRALNKISADVVVTLAAEGYDDLARGHLDLVRVHGNGNDGVDMTADCALSPLTARLQEHVESARRRADEGSAEAVQAARELLELAEASLAMYHLFGSHGASRKEIFDEVAGAVVTCAVTHQRKTEDNATFVALLERVFPLAVSDDVRERVKKNIEIGQGNLNLEILQPVVDALRRIRESDHSTKAKLAQIQQEILPRLTECAAENGKESALAEQLANNIAVALRGVSIEAHNNHDDYETALAAIKIAGDLARDSSLRTQISEDHAHVLRNKQQREQNNLSLHIRSDEVEITHELVRYNTVTLPASDITGVRFGVFTQYTNGIKTSTSYLVAVSSARHGVIEIECKRWFRYEDLAANDFQQIVKALYLQIIGGLCDRLAKQIVAGKEVPLGEWILTPKGLRGSTGTLFWKQDHLISWTDVRFGSHQGYLNISSATNAKASAAFSLRDVWNAPIFKELANAVVAELNRK